MATVQVPVASVNTQPPVWSAAVLVLSVILFALVVVLIWERYISEAPTSTFDGSIKGTWKWFSGKLDFTNLGYVGFFFGLISIVFAGIYFITRLMRG